MKKITTAALVSFVFLTNALPALASTIDIAPGTPSQGLDPNTAPQKVITNALTIVFIVAILMVLFFLIIGAFQWITSGGDKDKVGKARGTIVNALIGLAVLALAFVIITVVGQIVNINIHNLKVPSLDN